MESISLSAILPAEPKEIYKAWTTAKGHTAFTGEEATISTKKDGKFTAYSGYISGTNVLLESPHRIVQNWRTTEFREKDPDSLLEVIIEPHSKGSKVTILHSNIPKGQSKAYKKGWKDYYFEPLKLYFEE